tara:strand:+ start:358 stop:1041 length:684 start_codon:yes stop_codon:yes gene_type:complete
MSYLNHVLGYFDLAQNYRSYQLSLIKKFISGKILEVGPGKGEIIENFLNDKADITLADIDKEMCAILKDKFKDKNNVKIIDSNIGSIQKKFNTILYMDVIEHIEKDIKELDDAYSKLERDGYLVIIVPAFNQLFSDFDRSVGHYRRYNKNDFIKYAQKNKINIRKLDYFDSIGFCILGLSKFLNVKGNKNTVLGIKIWNLLIPISRTLDKIFFHKFGKSLICVFQKQ